MIKTGNPIISIYTEMTPNPETMKFVANKLLYPGKSIDFPDAETAKPSPLATELFGFPFIKSVFIASWVLLLFGLVYGIWGLARAWKNKTHKHFDAYEDGSIYVYEHKHGEAVQPKERYKVTPWVMFIIFLLGPCEPMIPLLYFPAAQHSWSTMLLLILVYTIFTLLTMIGMVVLGYYGLSFFKTEKLERYMHAIGGLTIFICGAGMVFIGW